MTIFMQRRTEPIYADFLDMPKTVAEMYQRVNDVNEAFLRLDPMIREVWQQPFSVACFVWHF